MKVYGYTVALGSQREKIPLKKGDAYDFGGLSRALARMRANAADKLRVTIALDDGVRLSNLVQTMDVARSVGFARITVRYTGDDW